MKLDVREREIERYGMTDNSFSIKATGKAFKILSSGLYRNKIKSIIRELSCNAYDAHVSVGKQNMPFDVQLPNYLEQTFKIRDYGPGLSEQQVYDVYTRYFESTKTESNDYVGALGLGSKSPFSYVDNYTVISYNGGQRTIYSLYLNEEGCPVVSCLGNSTSTQETGLEIIIALRQHTDTANFAQEARSVYKYFDPKPTITGVTDFKITNVEYNLENEHFKLVKNANAKPRVIMGNISYPIEVAQFYNKLKQKNNFNLSTLQSVPFEFRVQIGDVDFTAGREDLSYDQRVTVPRLVQLYDTALEQLQLQINETVASFTTEYAVRKWYANSNNLSGLFYTLRLYPVWNNKRIDSPIIKLENIDESISFESYAERYYYSKKGRLTNVVKTQLYAGSSVPDAKPMRYINFNVVEKSPVIFINDVKNQLHSRIERQVSKIKSEDASRIDRNAKYVVKCDDNEKLENFLKLFPDAVVYRVSELEKPEPVVRERTRMRILDSNAIAVGNSLNCTETDVDISTGGVYVTSYNGNIENKLQGSLTDNLSALVKMLTPSDNRVYVVPVSLLDKVKNKKNWHRLDELLKPQVLELLKNVDFNRLRHTIDQYSHLEANKLRYKFLSGLSKHYSTEVSKFVQKYTDVTENIVENKRLYHLAIAYDLIDIKQNYEYNESSLDNLYNCVYDKYPLLTYISTADEYQVAEYIKMCDEYALQKKTKIPRLENTV